MSDESDNFFSDKIAGAPHPMQTTKIIGHNSQKLDFLIVGNTRPTKKKIDQAKKLNIRIILEKEWNTILNS